MAALGEPAASCLRRLASISTETGAFGRRPAPFCPTITQGSVASFPRRLRRSAWVCALAQACDTDPGPASALGLADVEGRQALIH